MTRARSKSVQLFYFDQCPSYVQALENLKEALRLEHMTHTVEMIPVEDDADAHAKRFIGSPTVRIDGVDVEGPEADERGYGFGCRVYSAGSAMTGWPSIEQIRQALRRTAA